MQRKNRISYWSADFTDSTTGLITSAGFELTYEALIIWLQKNLEKLPKGEAKISKKLLRKG
jgi:hypothetical protein